MVLIAKCLESLNMGVYALERKLGEKNYTLPSAKRSSRADWVRIAKPRPWRAFNYSAIRPGTSFFYTLPY